MNKKVSDEISRVVEKFKEVTEHQANRELRLEFDVDDHECVRLSKVWITLTNAQISKAHEIPDTPIVPNYDEDSLENGDYDN